MSEIVNKITGLLRHTKQIVPGHAEQSAYSENSGDIKASQHDVSNADTDSPSRPDWYQATHGSKF